MSTSRTTEFRFKDGNRNVTAILFLDGSTCCNCRKWVRLTESDGSRICQHTEAIKRDHPQARARTNRYHATNSTVTVRVPAGTPVTVKATQGTTINIEGEEISRKFKFDE